MSGFSSPLSLHSKWRLLLLSFVTLALFSVLILQFYRIQVMEGERWSAVAERQHFFVVKEPFLRGSFWSNGSLLKGHPATPQPLVIDLQKFHLYADSQSIPPLHKESVARALSQFLGEEQLSQAKAEEQLNKRSRSRLLAMWLSRESHEEISKWWRGFAQAHHLPRNGLYFVKDYKRSYPYGHMLGQLLHTIQERKDETTKQAYPTGGLELQFNDFLRGKLGKRRLMRSPRNAFEVGEVIESPENGAEVHLTVNHVLQAICEEEIARAVEQFEAKAGWVIMMEPHTGELLALAQYPFFHPEHYRSYFNDPQKQWMTKVKAITDAYEPGSTMKPLNVALALEANALLKERGEPPLFDPEEKVPTANGHFPGRVKPVVDVRFHRFLNLNMALQKSSNIYLARLVERMEKRLGVRWYSEGLKERFGLGVPTGVELPAESQGILPQPSWGGEYWSQATPYSLAFGYNLQVTSLQMCRAYGILANGGWDVQPTLVRKVIKRHDDGSEELLLGDEGKITQNRSRVLCEATVRRVTEAMKYVMKREGGAFRGDLPGFTQAGKTGTTKKWVDGAYSSDQYFASCVGFTPAEHPRFVLFVALDEPAKKRQPSGGMGYYGGVCAAPTFRKVAKRALDYLGETPDDPYGYPSGDPRLVKELADWESEVKALKELYIEWNGS